jgi:hypothetical protein
MCITHLAIYGECAHSEITRVTQCHLAQSGDNAILIHDTPALCPTHSVSFEMVKAFCRKPECRDIKIEKFELLRSNPVLTAPGYNGAAALSRVEPDYNAVQRMQISGRYEQCVYDGADDEEEPPANKPATPGSRTPEMPALGDDWRRYIAPPNDWRDYPTTHPINERVPDDSFEGMVPERMYNRQWGQPPPRVPSRIPVNPYASGSGLSQHTYGSSAAGPSTAPPPPYQAHAPVSAIVTSQPRQLTDPAQQSSGRVTTPTTQQHTTSSQSSVSRTHNTPEPTEPANTAETAAPPSPTSTDGAQGAADALMAMLRSDDDKDD